MMNNISKNLNTSEPPVYYEEISEENNSNIGFLNMDTKRFVSGHTELIKQIGHNAYFRSATNKTGELLIGGSSKQFTMQQMLQQCNIISELLKNK